MTPEDWKQPRPVQISFDLRQLMVGLGLGFVLLCGWLLLGTGNDGGELLPLPSASPAVGAVRQKEKSAPAAQQKAEKADAGKSTEPKGKRDKKQAVTAPKPVLDPFSENAGYRTAPRTGYPSGGRGSEPVLTRERLRLSGIMTAGERRMALLSFGTVDLCLAEGEVQEGIALLEIGDSYVVIQDDRGERTLQLTNAPGGGRGRETRSEMRSESRSAGSRNTAK